MPTRGLTEEQTQRKKVINAEIKRLADVSEDARKREYNLFGTSEMTLGEIVGTNNAVLKAYPEFADIIVSFHPNARKNTEGMHGEYDKETNTIWINPNSSEKPNVILAHDGDIRFSISPKQDAAYLEAVRNGDMETAQRMVNDAAEAAGYTLGNEHRISHRAPYNNGENPSMDRLTELFPSDILGPNGAFYYGMEAISTKIKR
ncbi:MAG: hypothetical protein J6R79_02210 [Bacteroidaceae bacterium]|nr:hypothetical protein [Bacteroidaceae bacterium]